MKKKIALISIPVAILAIATFLILYFNIPRLSYEYYEQTDSYLVYKAYGNAKSYTIPKSHRGKAVSGVSTRAFFRHSKLEEVIFEDEKEITFIARLAFSECENLKSINLEYVQEIERNAFSYDTSLKSITTGAKYIGAAAFYGCSSLDSVILLDGVKSIGQNAFSKCISLTEIRLPNTVKNLYDDAFSNSGITKIYCSESLKTNKYLMSLDYVIYE